MQYSGPGTSWPPPDPDRIFRFSRVTASATAFTQSLEPEDFRKRQEADYQRQRRCDNTGLQRRQPFHVRYANHVGNDADQTEVDYDREEFEDAQGLMKGAGQAHSDEGEESWRNSEGERLADFGVEEDVEFYMYDEDDLPLSEVIKRRREQVASHGK